MAAARAVEGTEIFLATPRIQKPGEANIFRYLAKQGRVQESEAVFDQADKIAPGSPKVLFWRAKTYVQEKQNLDKAQDLLKRYLQCNLTPDDPPREEAEKLLQSAQAAARSAERKRNPADLAAVGESVVAEFARSTAGA